MLRLVDTLMAKYRDGMMSPHVAQAKLNATVLRSLHDSKSDFLASFIAYFDGEKDPRNLMIVFSILKVPMTEWAIGTDAQVNTIRCSHGFPCCSQTH